MQFGLDGLGPDSIEAVGVVWLSGLREKWTGLAINSVHRLIEGEGEPWQADARAAH